MFMSSKQYDYVFWDWNGTIIDDLDINFGVINSLLSNRNGSSILISEYRKSFTFPIKDFYGRVGLPVDVGEYEQLVHDYWSLYKSKTKDIPLMPGVKDVLSGLKKKQIKQYILSASDKAMVLEQMKMYGIQDFFEEVIAPQDGYALGKVELAKQWMSNRNISASNVVMIGDTIHDYETAMAINIDCALVDKGHQDLKLVKTDSNIIVYDDIYQLNDNLFDFE